MPEAFAVLAVFAIAIVAWVGAWLNARDPAQFKPEQESARLLHHEAWLKDRLQVARAERWGDDMISGLQLELAETVRQRARMDDLVHPRRG